MGRVIALEPSQVGRRGSEPRDAWQRMDTHPTPCLDLELVCGGTWFAGYR
jgi:hypothetical protein